MTPLDRKENERFGKINNFFKGPSAWLKDSYLKLTGPKKEILIVT